MYDKVGDCDNCGSEGLPVRPVLADLGIETVATVWQCEPCSTMPSGMADRPEGHAMAVCTNLILRELRKLQASHG